jgi:hypothetical protein
MAHAAASGSVASGCFENLPRHPTSFTSTFAAFAVTRICFAIPFALFFGTLSLGMHCFVLWIWKRFASPSSGGSFKALVENGSLLGFLQATLLGIPSSFVAYAAADLSLPGDDCPYALTDHFFLLIETDGVVLAYFAACVIAAVWAGGRSAGRAKIETLEELPGGAE